MFEYLKDAPLWIQLVSVLLMVVGAYGIYRFRIIVGMLMAFAIAIWVAFTKKKGDKK